MAFQSNAQQAPTNDSWKAAGFINFYLPRADGKEAKLGAIPLKLSKPNEKKLLDWLDADPANAAKLLPKLIVRYQSATPADTAGFALE